MRTKRLNRLKVTPIPERSLIMIISISLNFSIVSQMTMTTHVVMSVVFNFDMISVDINEKKVFIFTHLKVQESPPNFV